MTKTLKTQLLSQSYKTNINKKRHKRNSIDAIQSNKNAPDVRDIPESRQSRYREAAVKEIGALTYILSSNLSRKIDLKKQNLHSFKDEIQETFILIRFQIITVKTYNRGKYNLMLDTDFSIYLLKLLLFETVDILVITKLHLKSLQIKFKFLFVQINCNFSV